jgi:hypothetical protein
MEKGRCYGHAQKDLNRFAASFGYTCLTGIFNRLALEAAIHTSALLNQKSRSYRYESTRKVVQIENLFELDDVDCSSTERRFGV